MPPAKKRKSEEKNDEPDATEEKTDQEQFDAQQEEARQVQEGESGEEAEGVGQYQPRHRPLEAAGFDQDAAEEKRQAELAKERDLHNRLTGGGAQEAQQEQAPQEAQE